MKFLQYLGIMGGIFILTAGGSFEDTNVFDMIIWFIWKASGIALIIILSYFHYKHEIKKED